MVRFVNKLLLDQDSAAYDVLNAILPSNAKLERQVGCRNGLNEGQVQILDEADHFLLDGSGLDGQLHKQLTVFGVTATPLKSKSECLESKLLKMLHFNVLDSCVVPFAEEPEELIKTTLARFFDS